MIALSDPAGKTSDVQILNVVVPIGFLGLWGCGVVGLTSKGSGKHYRRSILVCP